MTEQRDRAIRFADAIFLIMITRDGQQAECLRNQPLLERTNANDDLLLAKAYRAGLAEDLEKLSEWIRLRVKAEGAER